MNVSEQRIAATISLFISNLRFLLSTREITKPTPPDLQFRRPNSPQTSIQIGSWGKLRFSCKHKIAHLNNKFPSPDRVRQLYSLLSASLKWIVRSTLPVESRIRISPERKLAPFCA